MKKLLLGSIVLTLFSISILLFQISCRKEVSARNMGDGTAAKVLMSKDVEVKYFVQTGVDSLNNPHFDERIFTCLEFYILKDDETAPAKINISLPPDEYPWLEACLSKDGSKIFFGTYHKIKGYSGVYACNVDGSDVHMIGDESFFLRDVK